MGLFSRKPKNKKTHTSAGKTTPNDIASTPGKKEVPATPETAKGAESPDTSTASPASISAENVTKPVYSQELKTQDEDQTGVTKAKKKHRTRISVTTPDEVTGVLGNMGEQADVDTNSSTETLDEREISDENIETRPDNSVDPDHIPVDRTFLDDDEPDIETTQNDESNPNEVTVNKNPLSNFEGCDILPDSLKAMLPESWQQADNSTDPSDVTSVKEPAEKMSYYSEEFATSFLQELLKKGFALVYHQPLLTIEEEKADWQGRSVTMNFKAGICNALEVFQPEIEWSTMGGGKDKKILTRSVALLDIHSISVSSSDDMRDSLEAGESEEIQCFFTMSTKSGDIHVFEAMNIDESKRLVLGIKNISGRYSNLIVAGDPRVIVEFFDNSSDPQEIRLPFERAIVQVSHAFLG